MRLYEPGNVAQWMLQYLRNDAPLNPLANLRSSRPALGGGGGAAPPLVTGAGGGAAAPPAGMPPIGPIDGPITMATAPGGGEAQAAAGPPAPVWNSVTRSVTGEWIPGPAIDPVTMMPPGQGARYPTTWGR